MTDKVAMEEDDFANFFAWQNSVLGKEEDKETSSEENDKKSSEAIKSGADLARCLRDNAKIPKFDRMSLSVDELRSFKLPRNREVELISKWKEVEKCQEELQGMDLAESEPCFAQRCTNPSGTS